MDVPDLSSFNIHHRDTEGTEKIVSFVCPDESSGHTKETALRVKVHFIAEGRCLAEYIRFPEGDRIFQRPEGFRGVEKTYKSQ
jgi:hypothetical protein